MNLSMKRYLTLILLLFAYVGNFAQSVPLKETARKQCLVFQISPPNATLEVNDQLWDLEEGVAQRFLDLGTYDYRVQAPNYYSDSGRVELNDPDQLQKVMVTLRPNFGWIEVKGDGVLQGAHVYIDNVFLGKAPCKSNILKSGRHTVRISKKMYSPYNGTVEVNDNETTLVAPTLTGDFAEVTLKVDSDAEIWVNNEKKGVRSWTGPLGSGSYKVECRQANHEPSLTTQEITVDMAGQTITLPAPRPIYGSLMVESSPSSASVYIDGEAIGETPKFIQEILVGEHEIKISKNGCDDYTETVTIVKGESKQVSAKLSNGIEIQFTCNVPNAQLEIDGQRVGPASGTYHLTYGSHSLKATADDYLDYTYSINVSETSCRSHNITMQGVLKDEETFTVNGVTFTMKLVEGGTFDMGATSEQANDANAGEKPANSVTLGNYYMGETEVTQALWQAVMGSNPSHFKGDNLPVESVSWNDCQEFISKLNQKTGKSFRLPTEAEWEYAARGGKKSKGCKYAGSHAVENVAWYYNNSNKQTHNVKTKQPNELGLYDMSGNVYEWCSDWYAYEYYGNSPSTNQQGLSSGTDRVVRGGGWHYNVGFCCVSSRHNIDPDRRDSNNGFRLALPQ